MSLSRAYLYLGAHLPLFGAVVRHLSFLAAKGPIETFAQIHKKRRVLSLLWASALTAIVLASTLSYYGVQSALRNDAQSKVVQHASLVEQAIGELAAGIEMVADRAVVDLKEGAVDRSNQALSAALGEIKTGLPLSLGTALTTLSGEIIAVSPTGFDDRPLLWNGLITKAAVELAKQANSSVKTERFLQIVIQMADQGEKRAFVAGRKLTDRSGRELVLILLFDCNQLTRKVLSPATHPDFSRLLLWRDGLLLGDSLTQPVALKKGFKQVAAINTQLVPIEDHFHTESILNAASVVGKVTPFSSMPFALVVEYQSDAEPAILRDFAFKMVGFCVGLLLLIVVITRKSLKSLDLQSELMSKLSKASAEVKQIQFRRHAMSQVSLDAEILVDKVGRVLELNPSAVKMFGYTMETAYLCPLDELVLPLEQRKGISKGIRPHIVNGAISGGFEFMNRRIEVMAVNRSGFQFPVEYAILPVATDGGLVYVVTIRNLSDRYVAEAALRASEERWKLALEAAGEGVWDWNISSGRVHYSAKWFSMLGYAEGEIENSHSAWQQLIHPSDGVYVLRELYAHLEGLTPSFSAECRMATSAGSWKWIHVRGMIVERLSADGSPTRLIGTHTDISERKEADDQRNELLVNSHELALELQRARETELCVGSKIQSSLLVTPQVKGLAHVWLSTFNQASQGVDGDFVEVICPNESTVDIVTGDVMGKGVNAALMGAAVKMQLSRSMIELMTGAFRSGDLPQPADVLQSLHLALSKHLQALDAFVTLCYVRIDSAADTVTWVGCGHEEALLLRHDGQIEVLKNQHPPLGVHDDCNFVQGTLPMHAHDSIFLHSDGVTDAILSNGERLGKERLCAELTRFLKLHETPAASLHLVRQKLLGDGVRFTDDLTMVLARRIGTAIKSDCLELEVSFSAISQLREMVESCVGRSCLTEKERQLIPLAAVEVFTNIVRHSRGRIARGPVEVVAKHLPNGFQLDLIYLGEHFDSNVTNRSATDERFPEGGFGLGIIQAACDETSYLHNAGINTVRLRKYRYLSVSPRASEMPELVEPEVLEVLEAHSV